MSRINLMKNIAILLDFMVSAVASALRSLAPKFSAALFVVSAVILFVAVVCVAIDFVSVGRLKKN